jgi:hypothetical protein
MKLKFVVLFIFVLTVPICYAQTFTANIKDLAFMKGKWFENHKWGDMEEYWGGPIGNNMVSSYRCVKDGKIVFYEFVVIEQSDSVPVMILRHFNPKSIGWEDKDHPNYYPLIRISRNEAVFKSNNGGIILTYKLLGPDNLEVLLEEKSKQGIVEKTTFQYTRQKE